MSDILTQPLTEKARLRLLAEEPPLTVYDAEDDNNEWPEAALHEDLREGLTIDEVVFDSDTTVTYFFGNGLYAVEDIDAVTFMEELG